jgi:DNA replicative helicase MCM subunit Mcm2 (Cdc46/Mcm family)
LRN